MENNQNTIEHYMQVELAYNNEPRRLIRTVAEFVDVQTGRIERNITVYNYRYNGHRCYGDCTECLFDRNLQTYIDHGETLDEMVNKNGGELPEDWFSRLPVSQQMFLEGVINDLSDRKINTRYYRRRRSDLRSVRCHANCETDAEDNN